MKDLEVTNAAHRAVGINNKRAGYYRKFKIDRNDVRPILQVATAARQYHRRMTVPWDRGHYRLLPATLILKYTKTMKEFKHDFFAKVDDLVVRWPTVISNCRKRLGSTFKQQDYPDAKKVKDFYSFETHFKPVPQDDHFILQVEHSTLEELKEKFNQDEKKNIQDVVESLWHRLFDPVKRMSEILNEQPKGKKPKIFDTLVNNLEDIVMVLPDLNINNDPQLTEMTKRIGDELCKFTPGQLRKDAMARKTTANAAKKIEEDMSAIMGQSQI